MGNRGKNEFIQVPRLMEVFSELAVAAAALDAIRLGAISFDAVKQLVIAKFETDPHDLGHYPNLPATSVKTISLACSWISTATHPIKLKNTESEPR